MPFRMLRRIRQRREPHLVALVMAARAKAKAEARAMPISDFYEFEAYGDRVVEEQEVSIPTPISTPGGGDANLMGEVLCEGQPSTPPRQTTLEDVNKAGW